MKADTFEQLASYLRTFGSFKGEGEYDFAGAFVLFEALLTNLAERHVGADLDGLADADFRLTQAQEKLLREVLRRFGASAEQATCG